MKKRGYNNMYIIIGAFVCIIGIAIVFFNMPYSKTRAEFERISWELTKGAEAGGVFSEEDIYNFPKPVQNYFKYCGYIGTSKMAYMKAEMKDVNFSLGLGKPNIKIDYTQLNKVNIPNRIAYIDSALYGAPFEGLDTYINGTGSMKGVLAKLVTLFNQTGKNMDRACLVTYLSECLIVPSAALSNLIEWEAIDSTHAKATISYNDISAGGVFTFNEAGEMTAFTSEDREAIGFNGKAQKVRWSAVCKDYREFNGIKKPTSLQAIWHYNEGDLIYFDAKDISIEFN